MKPREPDGTLTAHGQSWPLYGRPAYALKVHGYINKGDLYDPSALEEALRNLLGEYGVTITLEPIVVVSMSPEDQAEKFALDEAAVKADDYPFP